MMGMELNKRQREQLKALIGICEEPKCRVTDVARLHVHRIRRGNDGGEYVLRNIMVLCVEHHKIRHSMEPGCGA